MSITNRSTGFLLGLAAMLGAGLVMVAARLAANVPTPPEAALDAATGLIPPAVFAATLDSLKFAAKPLLVALLSVGQLTVGGLVGVAYAAAYTPARRRPLAWATGALLAGFGAFGLYPLLGWGALGRGLPAGAGAATATLILAGAAFALVLSRAAPLLEPQTASEVDRPESSDRHPLARRSLLMALGWGGVLVGAGALVRRAATVAAARDSAARLRPAPSLPPSVTPTDDFYVVSKNISDPAVDLTAWRLVVGGLVDHPLTLTYAELRALPSIEQYVTLECISNEVGGDLISTALWRGVRLVDLLARAGIKPGATRLIVTALDAYTDGLPIAVAEDPATILAYEINGEPLPPAHGFPARLVVPGKYGLKNVKWVDQIVIADSDVRGFWQQRGWSDDATVKTTARIDLPPPGEEVRTGAVELGGIAFAGRRGIHQVEVSTDGGRTWSAATAQPALSPYTWVLWTTTWQAAPGEFKVLVRATDGSGRAQDGTIQPTLPDGASGYHGLIVRVAPPRSPTVG